MTISSLHQPAPTLTRRPVGQAPLPWAAPKRQQHRFNTALSIRASSVVTPSLLFLRGDPSHSPPADQRARPARRLGLSPMHR
eukprot:13723644-Alexandrium_andersonii.AAC.1